MRSLMLPFAFIALSAPAFAQLPAPAPAPTATASGAPAPTAQPSGPVPGAPATEPPPSAAPAAPQLPGAPPVSPAPARSEPTPVPVSAPPSPSAEEATESPKTLPWFLPDQPHGFAPPPPSPGPKLIVSAFLRVHHFTGVVEGFASHVGATIGGRGAALMLGFVPSEGLFSVGVQLPRFRGVRLSSSPSSTLALLGPNFDAQLMSDFKDDIHFSLGGSALGIGFSSCSVVQGSAFFVQARLPVVGLYVPLRVNGRFINETGASPFLAIGGGLEAGLAFF